jgi:hypothetical protein
MSIDNNKEACANVDKMFGSIGNRVRAIYNYGYKDGYKDGANAVFQDILEKIISEKNIGGEGGDDE